MPPAAHFAHAGTAAAVEGDTSIDNWLVPIVADGEAGFGGALGQDQSRRRRRFGVEGADCHARLGARRSELRFECLGTLSSSENQISHGCRTPRNAILTISVSSRNRHLRRTNSLNLQSNIYPIQKRTGKFG